MKLHTQLTTGKLLKFATKGTLKMPNKSLIIAAIAAIENKKPDDKVNEAFARACEKKPAYFCTHGGIKLTYPDYCNDLRAVFDDAQNVSLTIDFRKEISNRALMLAILQAMEACDGNN